MGRAQLERTGDQVLSRARRQANGRMDRVSIDARGDRETCGRSRHGCHHRASRARLRARAETRNKDVAVGSAVLSGFWACAEVCAETAHATAPRESKSKR